MKTTVLPILAAAAGLLAAPAFAQDKTITETQLELAKEEVLRNSCLYRGERYGHGAKVRVALDETIYCWVRGPVNPNNKHKGPENTEFPVWFEKSPAE